MPFVTAPNLIEASDFTPGYSPDSEPAALEPGAVLDSMNVFIDREGNAVIAREGFRRLREELLAGTTHQILQINGWKTIVNGTATSYLICVVSTGETGANNVRLYAIDCSDMSVTRIDDAGVNWSNPLSFHWGMGIEGVWFGGSKGNEMYSWNPDGPTWNGTAATGNWKEVKDDIDAGIDTDDEYGRDFAFTGKETVFYSGDTFKATKNIRYDTWETGERYARGDRVSVQGAWGHTGTPKYWKSYRCVDGHVADADKKPGFGADQQDYWKKVRLPLPQDDDGETATGSWVFVPIAPETHVAAWHNNRLFLRADGYGTKNRVLYSAPIKPEKGADIPGVVFDPKDFAPGGDLRGPGGGWLSFTRGRNMGVIQALRSYGQYLLVFMGGQLWVLSGESEESWTIRHLGGHGCMGPQAHTQNDGLVYFLGNGGLFVTDGTTIEPAPGTEKVRDWLRDRIDVIQQDLQADDELKGQRPSLFNHNGYIWMTLSTPSGTPAELTVVYDPRTGSFWKTSLPVLDVARYSKDSEPHLVFCAPQQYTNRALVFEYGHESADGLDDTGEDVYDTQALTWYMRLAWWPFGLLREQRRIRRVWALVKGQANFILTAYRDWVESDVAETTTAVSSETPVHIEGETFADSHAVSFQVEGDAVPAAIYGVAVDTQFRRQRYHS